MTRRWKRFFFFGWLAWIWGSTLPSPLAAQPPVPSLPPPAWVAPSPSPSEHPTKEPLPSAANLKEAAQKIAKWLEDPALKDSEIGIALATSKGQLLYQHRAQELCIPASNTKLFTTAAALHHLGPHYRYQTILYADRPIDSQGTIQGNLYIQGSGDPTLRSEELWRLARDLHNKGLKKVTGRLYFDDSFFDEQTFGDGWKDHDHHRYRPYVAGISALSLNYNTLTLAISPSKEGKPAKITVDPPSLYLSKIVNQTQTSTQKTPSLKIRLIPSKNREILEVSGSIPLGSEPLLLWRRVSLPSWYTAFSLAETLRAQKIRISPWPLRKSVPPKAFKLLTLTSPHLSVILHSVGKQSSNFTAEQILKTISATAQNGQGSWRHALSLVSAFLKQIGIPDGYIMVNGSGVGRKNRFSPLHFIALLRSMYPPFVTAPEFLAVQAFAGLDGTLHHRMQKTPAQGRLRAKTGTLDGVSSLSGYLQTLAGDVLLLSLCMNGKVSHMKPFRKLQDRISILLASLPEKLP